MSQVGVTPSAGSFNPSHAVAQVFMSLHRLRRDWQPEARPTAARFELLIRPEKWRSAGDAVIHPVVMVTVECA